MRTHSKSLILGGCLALFLATQILASQDGKTVYPFKVKTLEGKSTSLAAYKGKVLLIVNVASKCGNTPQYAGLEKMYEKYKDKGLVILGFPCNQFGSQEPGTEKEIRTFCTSNYNVTFPLFSKIEVNGPKAHPLYKFLEKGVDIQWNFGKFLIGRDGLPIQRYEPKTQPAEVEKDVETALAAKP